MLKVPLGIFWDLKSCSIPAQCSPFGASNTIRHFVGSTYPECGYAYEFICAGDVRQLEHSVYDELKRNGVDIVHVDANCHVSTQQTLRESVDVFIDIFGTSSVFAIITADTKLEPTVKYALNRGLRVALIYGRNTAEELRYSAKESFLFDDVLSTAESAPVRQSGQH